MSWWYRNLVRPALFLQESEPVHNRTLAAMAWASHRPSVLQTAARLFEAPDLPTTVFGLKFPNPLGLAAGMDKHAAAVPLWSALGFGFSELGGVTWHPQPGNPQPRMFRAVQDEAVINRMGFNNPGAAAMADSLASWKKKQLWPRHPVGINLGKSKITTNDQAVEDYGKSFSALRSLADFFVVNVSSPNTPNLRELQDKAALEQILSRLQSLNTAQAPLLVKIAPDLSFEAIDEVVAVALRCRLSGIVATNTTLARPMTEDECQQKIYAEPGGLSGKPLRNRSTEIIRHIYRSTQGRLPIIGVGGVFNADDALAKIFAGASLIQVYTGLIYEGPTLARRIVKGIRARLAEEGIKDVAAAVGIAAR